MPVVQALRHPDELRANPWNSNVVSPENEAKLDASVSRLGVFKPIICRRVPGTVPELEILGGEHRWGAAKRIGLTEIPVIDLGPLTDVQAKEISLADNARYGSDDAGLLAEILKAVGEEEVSAFLPYSEVDFKSIFSAASISLEDLELDPEMDAKEAAAEPPAAKAPKTHTVMRFKVPVEDSEKLAALITKIQKRHGYTEADALTNAGDALIHLVYAAEIEA